jgi:predicted membrane metal-binding protein
VALDQKTHQAVEHTVHCLIGCGIGEILGMLIASALGWHRVGRLALAIILAFFFGYLLTYRSVRKRTATAREAITITLATDTVSITSMEVIDNTIEFIIPNALMVTAASFRFWWGLALSLSIAFVVTVPVNRYMISRHPHAHSH